MVKKQTPGESTQWAKELTELIHEKNEIIEFRQKEKLCRDCGDDPSWAVAPIGRPDGVFYICTPCSKYYVGNMVCKFTRFGR